MCKMSCLADTFCFSSRFIVVVHVFFIGILCQQLYDIIHLSSLFVYTTEIIIRVYKIICTLTGELKNNTTITECNNLTKTKSYHK